MDWPRSSIKSSMIDKIIQRPNNASYLLVTAMLVRGLTVCVRGLMTISCPRRPLATSRPSTSRPTLGANSITTPGAMLRVTPGMTVTSDITWYGMSRGCSVKEVLSRPDKRFKSTSEGCSQAIWWQAYKSLIWYYLLIPGTVYNKKSFGIRLLCLNETHREWSLKRIFYEERLEVGNRMIVPIVEIEYLADNLVFARCSPPVFSNVDGWIDSGSSYSSH